MNIIIACNKPLPIKLEHNVLFQRGKIKPYFIRYGFFVEATLQHEQDFHAIATYISDILSQYKNAEIELHTKHKSLYHFFLQSQSNLVYNCGSLYFYSPQQLPNKK